MLSLPAALIGRFVALVHASDSSSHRPSGPLNAVTRLARWACGDPYGAGAISFPVAFLERLCVAYHLPTSQPLLAAHDSLQSGRPYEDQAQLPRFEGYADYVRRHESMMRDLLATTAVPARLAAVQLVEPIPDELLTPYAAELAVLATSGSVKVRAAAEPLLDEVRCRRDEPAPRDRRDRQARRQVVGAAPPLGDR